ncbi:MAG: glucose-6-phosphate isomerase [Tissierellia bacterium]|nr:glucose-6-phosphate isomerase [Tissierellia bacterium]
MLRTKELFDKNEYFKETYEKAEKVFAVNTPKDMEFLDIKYDEDYIRHLENQADKMKDVSDYFILIGVGGSNGAARSVIEGLKLSDIKTIYAGNFLSPIQMRDILNLISNSDVCINVIAKNFKTIEPGSHFRMIREMMSKIYTKAELEKRIAVTGTPGELLKRIGEAEGYFVLDFEENVGGRFSAFSNVGIFPIIMAGGDIRSYFKGRDDMIERIAKDPKELLTYVAYRNSNFKAGKDIEILSSFDPRFEYFNKWWVQLFGESEGTNDTGIYPDSMLFSEDLHSMGQYIQAGKQIFMETFLRIRNYPDIEIFESNIDDDFDYLNGKNFAQINRAMEEATIKAHTERNIPAYLFEIDDLDEYHFGQLYTFFLMAVLVSARVMDLSPFEQYGVEAYKNNMFKRLRGLNE